MARYKSNVLFIDAGSFQLCGKRVAEAVEANTFREAQVFEVVAELNDERLAVSCVRPARCLVHTR